MESEENVRDGPAGGANSAHSDSRESSVEPLDPERGIKEGSVDSLSGLSGIVNSETALFNAINNLDVKAVERLCKNGMDLTFNATVYKGRTALHELVLTHMSHTPLEWTSDLHMTFIDILTLLIQNGVDVNAADQLRKTALHYACTSSGRSEIMKVLLASGVKANSVDNCQQTALHKSVVKGNIRDVETLLEGGTNPNILDVMGYTPLHLAAKRKHNTGIIQALLNAGANVNIRIFSKETSESLGSSPLHLAVKFGSLDNARLLLTSGADVSLRDASGQTPIILAARHDLTGKMMALLHEFKANLNDQDTVYGETPLHKVVRHDMIENLAYLIKHRADPNKADVAGDTPLHAAAVFCYKSHIWVRLITMGGYVNVRNNSGQTPIDKALKAKNYIAAGLMRDAGFTRLS